jgi:hypothetical protein
MRNSTVIDQKVGANSATTSSICVVSRPVVRKSEILICRPHHLCLCLCRSRTNVQQLLVILSQRVLTRPSDNQIWLARWTSLAQDSRVFVDVEKGNGREGREEVELL